MKLRAFFIVKRPHRWGLAPIWMSGTWRNHEVIGTFYATGFGDAFEQLQEFKNNRRAITGILR